MDDIEFQSLDEVTQRHAFFIYLLCAKTANRLPFDREWVARHIFARSEVDLDALITVGFLEGYNNESRAMLAKPYQNAPSETEERRDSDKNARVGR